MRVAEWRDIAYSGVCSELKPMLKFAWDFGLDSE